MSNQLKVYILRRENSWQPELLREGITELSANNGETWSCIIDDEENTSIQEITWGSSYVSI